MDKRILTLTGVIAAIALIIFLIKFSNRKKCPNVDFDMVPNKEIKAGEPVKFIDNSENSESWSWTFSDGSEYSDKNITKAFQMPGKYAVTLMINNDKSCFKSDSFLVLDAELAPAAPALAYAIEGPEKTFTGQSNIYKARGSGGKSFLWSFGENANYDGNADQVSYSYKSPGNYEIELTVDGQSFKKKIHVVFRPEKSSAGTSPPKTKPEELVKLLNEFGVEDNPEEKGKILAMIKKKLCNNESIPVTKTNDNQYQKSLEKYYQSMMFSYKPVKNISLEYDQTNCVSKIVITE